MVIMSCIGADNLPGDFLVVQRIQGQPTLLTVCQVRQTLTSQELEVLWQVEGAISPPLCPLSYENLLRCRAWGL
jgi:hypothetical protein